MMFFGVNESKDIKCKNCKHAKKPKSAFNSYYCKKYKTDINSSECSCEKGKNK